MSEENKELDIGKIASAVARELAKLNVDTKEKDKTEEIFKCPDCDSIVKGGIAYCQNCGCPLEWGE